MVGQAERVSSADPILGLAVGPDPTSSPSPLAGGRGMQGVPEPVPERDRLPGPRWAGSSGTGVGPLGEPGPELQLHPLPTRILSAGLLPGASALPYQGTSSVLKAALARFVRPPLTPGSYPP